MAMAKPRNDNRLPPEYKPGLPRVSEIVSWAFPFDKMERFTDWLDKYGVSYEEYMKEACEGGRYVHSKLETYCKTWEKRFRKYRGWVESGIRWVEENGVRPIDNEVYVSCKHYQGTADIVFEMEGKKYVGDWKSWWLWKSGCGIPESTYRKPYDKLKKARLQLSLYARVLKVDAIAVIELRQDGYYFHELEPYSQESIDLILREFKNSYVDCI